MGYLPRRELRRAAGLVRRRASKRARGHRLRTADAVPFQSRRGLRRPHLGSLRHGPPELGEGLFQIQRGRGQRRPARPAQSGGARLRQRPRLRAAGFAGKHPYRAHEPLRRVAVGRHRRRRLAVADLPALDDPQAPRDVSCLCDAPGRKRLDQTRHAGRQRGQKHPADRRGRAARRLFAGGLCERSALRRKPAERSAARAALQRLSRAARPRGVGRPGTEGSRNGGDSIRLRATPAGANDVERQNLHAAARRLPPPYRHSRALGGGRLDRRHLPLRH